MTQRIAWFVVLAMLAVSNVFYVSRLISAARHPEQHAQPNFFLGETPNTVMGMYERPYDDGLRRLDRLIAINGQPFRGLRDYAGFWAHAKPGDPLVLEVVRPSTGQRLTIRTQAVRVVSDGSVYINFVLYGFALASLFLGMAVTWIKPNELRAWLLLGLMAAVAPFFHFQGFHSSNTVFQVNEFVLGVVLPGYWPILIALLGVYFPERLKLPQYIRWPLLAVCVPVFALSTAASAYFLARHFSLDAALPLWNWIAPTRGVFRIAVGFPIGMFFACAALQIRMAATPEIRRRAVLLNAGAHISLVPMFLVFLRALITRRDLFIGLPPVVIIAVMMCFGLFPLTLVYLVIVHRALDIRVVLRTGMQYALATRGVLTLQVLLSIAIVVSLLQYADQRNRPQRIMLLALAFTGVMLLRLIAGKLRAWADRRFFREACNAEQMLGELSDEVRSIVETQPLLETVARRISESMHVTRIAMLLAEGGSFQPAYSLGMGNGAASFAGGRLIDKLRNSRGPHTLYLDDPASWVHRELSGEEREGLAQLHSQLLLPLASKHGLLGFISLGPKLSEEPYSRADLHLLRSVAAQTGLAVENARLTAAVARESAQRERLNREMEIARDVQQRLFPHRLPMVTGIEYAGDCRPAQSIGGDYYDFFETPNGQFGFAIGDVSGKGVPAALLMAVLHASVRGQAIHTGENLATLIGHVNRLIYDASAKSHFATLFHAQYDPAASRLIYVNAGHNPPILLRASGDVEWLKATGTGTGLTRLARYTQQTVDLLPGDTLIAYTDGFTEAMNTAREEFGEERLLDACRASSSDPPRGVITRLLGAVDAFAAGAEQHDDMTVVVLRRV